MDNIGNNLYYFDMNLHEMQVRRAEKTYCLPSWQWTNPVQRFDGYLFWLILDGEGTLRTESAQYPLGRGDCFIMRMWEKIEGRHSPQKPLVVPWIHFEFVDRRGKPFRLDPPPIEYRKIAPLFMAELAQRAIRTFREGNAEETAKWMQAVWLEIARLDRQPSAERPAMDWRERIEQLCNRMQENPAWGMRVSEISGEMHCTADHLIRVFKRIKGITPAEFLVRARVERAKDLLLYSSHSMGQIAETLGYADGYYFSRQFKERTGRAPSFYRKERP